jgi:hypothetical protein
VNIDWKFRSGDAGQARVIPGVCARQEPEAAGLRVDQVVAIENESEIAGIPPLGAIADTVGHESPSNLLEYLKPGGTLGCVLGEPPAVRGKSNVIRSFRAHLDAKRFGDLANAVARLASEEFDRVPATAGADQGGAAPGGVRHQRLGAASRCDHLSKDRGLRNARPRRERLPA